MPSTAGPSGFSPPRSKMPAQSFSAGEEVKGTRGCGRTRGASHPRDRLVRGRPPRELSRLDFARALGRLAGHRGADLLRVKGIVRFSDRPESPAIVQAAQHAMFAPEWLDDGPTRIGAAGSSLSSTKSRERNSGAFRLRGAGDLEPSRLGAALSGKFRLARAVRPAKRSDGAQCGAARSARCRVRRPWRG